MINYQTDTIKVGETWSYTWDLTSQLNTASTTISSATWSVCSGSSVTIGTNSFSGALTQALLTAASGGVTIIETAVVYANGEKGLYQIQISTQVPC